MNTSATAPVTADRRLLPQRARHDLEANKIRFARHFYWNVKDPLTLRYYQLREEEYFILNLLNGERSLGEIQELVEQRFAPQRVGLRHLQAFLAMLHHEGLTVIDASGQGDPLRERRHRLRVRKWWSTLASPLAIRFRGIDPTFLLDAVHRRLSWLFQRSIFFASALVILGALVLMATSFHTVQEKLPEVEAFLSITNVGWLAVTLFCVKLLHELGHGVTCRHLGVECYEAGIMLLVGVPCFYCNVSDAWMLPSKWKRLAISGAGIWVELTLAALCTFAWWFSTPGLFNALCFNVVVLCSVSTLFLNGNPLLRFDGYYLLSDWMEVPNLWQEAKGQLNRLLARAFLGIEGFYGRVVPLERRVFLTTYAVASLAYRVLVITGILWVCLLFFRQHRMAPIGHLLIVTVLGGLFVTWGTQLWSRLRNPLWSHQVNQRRLAWSTIGTLLLLLTAFLVPLPHRIRVPMTLVPGDAARVYVKFPGVLQWAAAPGRAIDRGQPLAVLRDFQEEQELQGMTQRYRLQALAVEQLRRRRIRDPRLGAELPAAEELENSFKKQLAEQERQHGRLTLRAPRDGVVVRPRYRRSEASPTELAGWSGTPLDLQNIGSYLESDTLFCWVGNPNVLEGLAIIDQGDVEAVRPGQRIRVRLDAMPGRWLQGTVEEIERLDLTDVPPELAASKKLATSREGAPARTSYRARLAIDAAGHPLLIGSTGSAQIYVDRLALGSRLWQTLRRTFQFSASLPVRE